MLALMICLGYTYYLFCTTHNGIMVGMKVTNGSCIGRVIKTDGDAVVLNDVVCGKFIMNDVTLSSRDLRRVK